MLNYTNHLQRRKKRKAKKSLPKLRRAKLQKRQIPSPQTNSL